MCSKEQRSPWRSGTRVACCHSICYSHGREFDLIRVNSTKFDQKRIFVPRPPPFGNSRQPMRQQKNCPEIPRNYRELPLITVKKISIATPQRNPQSRDTLPLTRYSPRRTPQPATHLPDSQQDPTRSDQIRVNPTSLETCRAEAERRRIKVNPSNSNLADHPPHASHFCTLGPLRACSVSGAPCPPKPWRRRINPRPSSFDAQIKVFFIGKRLSALCPRASAASAKKPPPGNRNCFKIACSPLSK